MWLSHADYEAGREIKLDFSRYDVVLRAPEHFSLDSIFERSPATNAARSQKKMAL
jgi:hypothetical protein